MDLGDLTSRASRSAEEWLFGEGPGGWLLAGEIEEIAKLVEAGLAVPIGAAGGGTIRISVADLRIEMPLADAAAAWRSLAQRMDG